MMNKAKIGPPCISILVDAEWPHLILIQAKVNCQMPLSLSSPTLHPMPDITWTPFEIDIVTALYWKLQKSVAHTRCPSTYPRSTGCTQTTGALGMFLTYSERSNQDQCLAVGKSFSDLSRAGDEDTALFVGLLSMFRPKSEQLVR